MWRRARSVIVQRLPAAPYSATLMQQKFSGSVAFATPSPRAAARRRAHA
jgi:hypothetical protein